jgi:hypothetical protein
MRVDALFCSKTHNALIADNSRQPLGTFYAAKWQGEM